MNRNGGRISVFMFMIMLPLWSAAWAEAFFFLPSSASLSLNLRSGFVDLHVWIVTPTDGQGSGDAIWLPAFPTAEPCQHLALIWSVINVSPYRWACSSRALSFLLQPPSLALALQRAAWQSSISPHVATRGTSWRAVNVFSREIAHTVFFNRIISCLFCYLSYPLFAIVQCSS